MIINGNEIRDIIKLEIKKEVEQLLLQNKPQPCLCVVMVGNDPASSIYVRNKEKACADVGIKSKLIHLEESISQNELHTLLDDLSKDETVHGILLQLPLPNGLNGNEAVSHISPKKDVDGLTVENLGNLMCDKNGLYPCTPSGIMEMFKVLNIPLAGKNVVIINRSLLVGKPISQMLMNANATVTVCHSHTTNLKMHTLLADIIITAAGKVNLITADMVKDNAIVVDVAIIRQNKKICGDVDFESVSKKCSFITPVPGGVGPLTIAMLLKNTLKAYKNSYNKKEISYDN